MLAIAGRLGDRMTKISRYTSVVDKAVEQHAFGSPTLFAKQLSGVLGRTITKQMVVNWRRRKRFSRDVVLGVHQLTRIPLPDLLSDD